MDCHLRNELRVPNPSAFITDGQSNVPTDCDVYLTSNQIHFPEQANQMRRAVKENPNIWGKDNTFNGHRESKTMDYMCDHRGKVISSVKHDDSNYWDNNMDTASFVSLVAPQMQDEGYSRHLGSSSSIAQEQMFVPQLSATRGNTFRAYVAPTPREANPMFRSKYIRKGYIQSSGDDWSTEHKSLLNNTYVNKLVKANKTNMNHALSSSIGRYGSMKSEYADSISREASKVAMKHKERLRKEIQLQKMSVVQNNNRAAKLDTGATRLQNMQLKKFGAKVL